MSGVTYIEKGNLSINVRFNDFFTSITQRMNKFLIKYKYKPMRKH